MCFRRNKMNKQEEITKIENQLMLLGLNGMAYTSEWNRLVKLKEQLSEVQSR